MHQLQQRQGWTAARVIVGSTLVAFTLAGLVRAQTPPTAPPALAAAPGVQQAQKSFSKEELDQILAPIALYPDNLLAQILMASTYPLEIVQAERWVKANPKLKDKALEDALQKQPWEAAVKSLAAVPQVLTMMSEKIDWTQKLGDAFLAQKQDVFQTVQTLRTKANAQGNLKTTPEQTVVTEVVESKTIIKIESSNPEVVYVPTYNPTVVYGSWWSTAYTPYYYYPPGYVAGGAFLSFTAGVIVGGAIWGNCNWGGNDVNINVNKYNNFNKTNISNGNWQHKGEHRGQVPYRDQKVASQYGGNRAQGGAQNRDAYRGRDSGPSAGTRDVSAGSRDVGGGRNGAGASAGTREAGAGGRDGAGASAGARDVAGGSRGGGAVSAGTRDAGTGGRSAGGGGFDGGSREGNASAFSGGSGASTRAASSRGASSMASSRGGGGRGGGRR
ncbi:MAG: DUF3300 domain-containing protein [Burkholderiales bacterium]|nr:DUF3300 domain-containing protein [Burkholderiales bacterium]